MIDKNVEGYIIMRMKIGILITGLILILLFFIYPVSAIIDVNASNVGTTYIEWTWVNGITLTKIDVDGQIITGGDLDNNYFILSNLKPNEIHQIEIDTPTDSGTNQTETLPLIPIQTNQEILMGFFLSYIWWIMAVVVLAYAAQSHSVIMGYISAILSLIGMVKGISDQSFLVYMLYVVTFLSTYWVTEINRR